MLRSEVIAWTAFDPALDNELYECCATVDNPCYFFPCCWPCLICISPCVCNSMIRNLNFRRSQFWILTETDLHIVHKCYDLCYFCIPGCSQSGDYAKSIPLDSIANCKNVAKGHGCLDCCIDPPPTLLVTSEDGQEVEGLGLANQALFIREILNRRDILKGRRKPDGKLKIGRSSLNHKHHKGRRMSDHELPKGRIIPMAVAEVIPETVMDRGSTKSAADRMKEINDFRDSGVLTNEEYTRKRQEIIDSL